MKNLFRNFLGLMMMVSVLSLSFVACSDDDDEPSNPADKTELNALINECQTLLNNASTDDYPQTAITAFGNVLNAAKTAAASSSITQQQVDNLVVQLTEAENLFLASAYGAIPGEAMVFALDFNEPNDVELTTTGLRQLKAKLMAGPSEIFGSNTAKPTFVDGVKGGKAMHFAQGGHLEIPEYNPSDLLKNTMSIAVWVKPDSTRAGNYITSLNFWKNWKFNLQTENKPFFTVQTTVGGPVNADNEAVNSAPNGKWTHLVVVLNLPNTLSFYVNGTLTKEWTTTEYPDLSGNMTAPFTTTIPFLIGAANTYAGATQYYDWQGWNTPQSWDYFAGSMDNLRYYNIALTDGQVSKLYNDEKP